MDHHDLVAALRQAVAEGLDCSKFEAMLKLGQQSIEAFPSPLNIYYKWGVGNYPINNGTVVPVMTFTFYAGEGKSQMAAFVLNPETLDKMLMDLSTLRNPTAEPGPEPLHQHHVENKPEGE